MGVGAHRIYKLRHRVQQVAVILPFEEKYFRDQGVNATYVGHPLVDRLGTSCADAEQVKAIRGRGEPVLALAAWFPRPMSWRPSCQDSWRLPARSVASSLQPISASPRRENLLPPGSRAVQRAGVSTQIVRGDYSCLVEAADLVLVASGTAALEVAFFAKPMIVMYQASRAFYHLLGRWMIHAPFLSLPNILAQGRSFQSLCPTTGPPLRSPRRRWSC